MLRDHDWDTIARRTEALYLRLLGRESVDEAAKERVCGVSEGRGRCEDG